MRLHMYCEWLCGFGSRVRVIESATVKRFSIPNNVFVDNGGGQKQQARFQRRVDPGNRARNESTPGRKSAPQRSREFDNKRPRARGNYQNDRPRPEVR